MKLKKDTICVQGGWQPKNGEPRVLPIYQSTTFRYETSEEMGKLFDLEKEGYFYSRLQNPTCDIVAQKICDLEGGVAAMLTSSGQAATMLAVTNICEAGDHIICAAKIYGGTSNLLAVTLHRFGVEVDLVDQDLPEEELGYVMRVRAVLDCVAALSFLLKGQFANMWAVLRARRAFHSLRPLFAADREENLKKTSLPVIPERTKSSILVQFYLHGKKFFSRL